MSSNRKERCRCRFALSMSCTPRVAYALYWKSERLLQIRGFFFLILEEDNGDAQTWKLCDQLLNVYESLLDSCDTISSNSAPVWDIGTVISICERRAARPICLPYAKRLFIGSESNAEAPPAFGALLARLSCPQLVELGGHALLSAALVRSRLSALTAIDAGEESIHLDADLAYRVPKVNRGRHLFGEEFCASPSFWDMIRRWSHIDMRISDGSFEPDAAPPPPTSSASCHILTCRGNVRIDNDARYDVMEILDVTRIEAIQASVHALLARAPACEALEEIGKSTGLTAYELHALGCAGRGPVDQHAVSRALSLLQTVHLKGKPCARLYELMWGSGFEADRINRGDCLLCRRRSPGPAIVTRFRKRCSEIPSPLGSDKEALLKAVMEAYFSWRIVPTSTTVGTMWVGGQINEVYV
eukprot:Polyplicarium_translucidae@DN3168_c0_g1_i2.p1